MLLNWGNRLQYCGQLWCGAENKLGEKTHSYVTKGVINKTGLKYSVYEFYKDMQSFPEAE